MANVIYTEYEPRHAQAIADMWNRSGEGWQGRFWNSSASKVLQEQQNSPYLNLYLAMDGDAVLGYARLCNYSHEPGVAYIEMLNVVPPCHGQGIGRDLVKRCVLRAAELGFGRIDLFTWAGNLKAMPLYKKCGFFWEKMDSGYTHLMNFLPGLMNTELLRPEFEFFDWYKDQDRELTLDPDGRLEQGFELYDYLWRKDGRTLFVAVERQGRGIHTLRTENYEIKTLSEVPEPVFGADYSVSYQVTKLNVRELDLSLRGLDDGEVRHNLDFKSRIAGSEIITSRFSIESSDRRLSEWESHPGICAELTVKGMKAMLKTGLKIHAPLSLDLCPDFSSVLPGRESRIFLNLESHFPQTCMFELQFPDTDGVKLAQQHFQVSLEAFARQHLPLSFSAEAAAVFAPQVRIIAKPGQERPIEFARQPSLSIPMLGSQAQAVAPDGFYLLSSLYSLVFQQERQKNWGYFQSRFGTNVNLNPPQIGLPYSDEFENLDPVRAEVFDLGHANRLELTYSSRAWAGCEFTLIHTLYPCGLLEYGIRALQLPAGENLRALLMIGLDSSGFTYQSGGNLISLEADLPDVTLHEMLPLDPDSNWVYSGTKAASAAVIWAPGERISLDRWWLAWEVDLAKLRGQETPESPPLRIYLDVFKNALQVGSLALNLVTRSDRVHPTLDLIANHGDPSIGTSLDLELILRQDSYLQGSARIFTTSRGLVQEERITQGEKRRNLDCKFALEGGEALETVACELDLPVYQVRREQLLLRSSGELTREVIEAEHGPLLVLDNGCLMFSAASSARQPGIVSLVHAGHEWLESGYPDFGPRGTYNPFVGGLTVRPQNISLPHLQEERHQAEFSALRDNWGNWWSGIGIETRVEKFKALRGMVFRQHYLTRPGLPVLAVQTEIVSSYGKAEYCVLPLYAFVVPDRDIRNGFIRLQDENGAWRDYHAGREPFYHRNNVQHTVVGSASLATRMHLLSPRKGYRFYQITPEIMMQGIYAYSELLDATPQFLPPLFLIWSDQELRHESCSQILALTFGSQQEPSDPA